MSNILDISAVAARLRLNILEVLFQRKVEKFIFPDSLINKADPLKMSYKIKLTFLLFFYPNWVNFVFQVTQGIMHGLLEAI